MRPSRILALILVMLVFPVTVWAQQQQPIYACVKTNNGQMRFVAAGTPCLPSEKAVSWAASASTNTMPPTAPTTGPLKVVDANNAVVGLFVPGQFNSFAARQAGDVWVAIPVKTSGLLYNNSFDFFAYYLTSDCTGERYLPLDSSTILRTGFLLNEGGAKFYYPTTTEVSGTAMHSAGYYYEGVLSCSLDLQGPPLPFGKVGFVDLSAVVGPFKIVQ